MSAGGPAAGRPGPAGAADAARAAGAPKPLHLFNGFMNPHGGSEQEALALYALLRTRGADAHLWATSSRASAALCERHAIRPVAPFGAGRPNGGNYVFFGAHWRSKPWPYLIARPDRLIYVFNTFHPKLLALTSRMPALLRWPRVEYVAISEFQRTMLGLQAEVHPSPIDIGRFAPVPGSSRTPESARTPASLESPRLHGPEYSPRDRPVVGRISRDTPAKHHPDDAQVYRALVEQGCAVRLQGATCLAAYLQGIAHLEITPEGHLPAREFLHGLDVFYYRTGAHVETFGRVVIEAMACGLPVVCHAHGGYADLIRHGDNGFLFRDGDEAVALVRRLAAQPGLRARVGAAARQTVERLYDDAAQQRRVEFYLR